MQQLAGFGRPWGGVKIITYTLQRESGSSLRGAGWTPVKAIQGEQWDRAARGRTEQAIFDEHKIRWEAIA